MSMRVFIDMDGVLADFDGLKKDLGLENGDQLKVYPLAFKRMQPIAGAIEAVRSIIGMGYEVWIASKPATGIPQTYADKADWILRNLPELKRRIILTHDKGLLGDAEDFLIDDRPHKANCRAFRGTLIEFTNGTGWPQVLRVLRGKIAPADFGIAECGYGWASLYIPLVARVRAEGGRVVQIKEKFGGMRFYTEGAPLTEELQRDIQCAEGLSRTICEQCGAPGKSRNLDGWWKTLCEEHHATVLKQRSRAFGEL